MSLHRRPLARTAAVVTVAAAALAPGAASADPAGGELLLRSGLAGSEPTDPTLFGVAPGRAPWVTDHNSSVRLRQDGHLDVKIRGLVIPDVGNPVALVSVSVVCGGAIAATTGPVPMGTTGQQDVGDARIKTTVDLPSLCLAPSVLVHPNGNSAVYIAANG